MTEVFRQRLRMVREEASEPIGVQVTEPAGAATLAAFWLRDEWQEVTLVLFFDRKHRLRGYQEIGRGGLHAAPLEPRDVLVAALYANAAAIMLVHNHPSGDATPSPDDIAVTRRIARACDLVGLELLDHLIVGETWRSLRAEGVIS